MNAELGSLKGILESLQEKMNAIVSGLDSEIRNVSKSQRISAINLLQYLTLRKDDARALQDRLHIAGLSSLASSESHILRQVQAILQRLGKKFPAKSISPCDYAKGRELIKARSTQLFGTKNDSSIPYLMVTFDSDFADSYQMIRKLLESGMNVARINCAHDDQDTWRNMVELLRIASEKTGIPCKIYMDIGGSKLRATILGKGRQKETVNLYKGQDFTLAEIDADYDPSDIVIGCEEPGVVEQLKTGERILFDDGIIEAKVISNKDGLAVVNVVRVPNKKPRLRAQKGMNFPDSQLKLPALTKNDLLALPFICENADLVGFSFIRHASEIKKLQRELSRHQKRPGIILKIETADAVRAFPSLLMQGMREDVFGVMIARGDLAVEIGFERMSEIQEEIVWISEAAHVPVIWATQVLENLNKFGVATRSEVTDAFYAGQSECVMLNKGDYIISTMKTLRDILHRSGGHHVKKRFTFRPMKIAADFFK